FTSLRYARRLCLRRIGADVGVQTAGGSRQQVGRYGLGVFRVVFSELLDRSLDTVDELLVCGPVIRPARVRGVISVRAGRRRARLEVLGSGKALADQFRADYLVTCRYQAPVGLMREENLTDAGEGQWISDTSRTVMNNLMRSPGRISCHI